MDFVVSVEPFSARFYIYQLGFPDSFQQCCSNKPTSVLRVPIGIGRFYTLVDRQTLNRRQPF
jgi:hypothetical protein